MDVVEANAILNAVGTRLRSARMDQGLSLAEAARRLGMSESVLSRVERARRDSGLLRLVMTSSALGVRLSDVLRLAEDDAFPLGSAPWTDCRTTASRGVAPADQSRDPLVGSD
jgi:transcriptional regulator with XRE-family HTH domain